jgi:glutaconyl-CoA decarboxylase subunit alpha
MRQYFEKMDALGKALKPYELEEMADNRAQIAAMLEELDGEVARVQNAGLPAARIRERGEMTVWDRIEYLVDPGTFRPLHTLYNPRANEEGTTGVVDGLARIRGKWCVVVGFDNKVLAGAWISGQAENQLRVTDLAKRLHVPLVWLVNCSGVKLPEQAEVYATVAATARRSSATRSWRSSACRSWPASTAPTRPAAATRASAPRCCSRTRTPTWRWAAPAS